ncbi:MAG: hypothetical protein KAS80_01380, partial [Anaerolineales bacterium]|nr:hypothetical protein [Anaerolineales bacterium]
FFISTPYDRSDPSARMTPSVCVQNHPTCTSREKAIAGSTPIGISCIIARQTPTNFCVKTPMDLTFTFQINRNREIPVTVEYIKQYKSDQNQRRCRQTL